MNSKAIKEFFAENEAGHQHSILKWTKILSIVYFIQGVVFFLVSFLPFFIKRTIDTDPRLISGAFTGTVQLTFFIVINIVAAISFFLGFYLYKFSVAFRNSELNDITGSGSNAIEFLNKYFRVFGAFTAALFIIGFIVLVIYLTGI